jgi:SAM-dependent methyltransferase
MNDEKKLPDFYPYVAEDIVRLCKPRPGIWVDLGCGAGPVGFALAAATDSVMAFLDPDREALQNVLRQAEETGIDNHVVALCGHSEELPFADDSVALVCSRGSIFFWNDRPAGLREIYRVLRQGGKAMIGGGLGSGYPLWARQEFIRRRRSEVRNQGPDAQRAFREVREPETFRKWAEQAGLPAFEIIGEGGLDEDDPSTGLGIWLVFGKEAYRA